MFKYGNSEKPLYYLLPTTTYTVNRIFNLLQSGRSFTATKIWSRLKLEVFLWNIAQVFVPFVGTSQTWIPGISFLGSLPASWPARLEVDATWRETVKLVKSRLRLVTSRNCGPMSWLWKTNSRGNRRRPTRPLRRRYREPMPDEPEVLLRRDSIGRPSRPFAQKVSLPPPLRSWRRC